MLTVVKCCRLLCWIGVERGRCCSCEVEAWSDGIGGKHSAFISTMEGQLKKHEKQHHDILLPIPPPLKYSTYCTILMIRACALALACNFVQIICTACGTYSRPLPFLALIPLSAKSVVSKEGTEFTIYRSKTNQQNYFFSFKALLKQMNEKS